MGMHGSYIGPVIVAEYDIRERPVPYRNCGNKSCPRYAKHKKPQTGKFCNQCGSEIITFHDRTEQYVFPEWRDVDDALSKAGLDSDSISLNNFVEMSVCHLYEPLHERECVREFNVGTFDDAVLFDMEGIDIEAEKKWLSTAYAKEIELLKTLYVSVDVKWLVINW